MPARLRGVRIACFYPWNPFEPTGAWSRFSCLWRFLLEEGAEVTLAFLDKGCDAQLKNVSIRYSGEPMFGENQAEITRIIASVLTAAETKQYSRAEIDFIMRYEREVYLTGTKTGLWIERTIAGHDLVTCEYPLYAPLLSDYCKRAGKPLVVTSHDMLFELHGTNPKAKERLKQRELQSMRLADAVVFCNDAERELFAKQGLQGVTVLNTGDVLSVTPGEEAQNREVVRASLKIKTPQYCLFVGTAHAPNLEAVTEVRALAKVMPDLTFVVAGNCSPAAVENNFIATSRVSDELLDALYRGALAVVVPLLRGTGMSVKIFQAFTYGKAIVSTPVGARGHEVSDGRELLLASSPAEFPAALRRLQVDEGLRASLGQAARRHAESLDFRTHFSPYADIVTRLLNRAPATEPRAVRALILIDNNLTGRVGHHFNYALAIKEHSETNGVVFRALVNQAAPADVLAELAATGAFSMGIHDALAMNPYPAEWRNLRSLYDFLRANDLFAQELETGLANTARPGDVVFLPNATPRQMLGVALLLQRSPLCRTLEFVLLLRYSIHLPNGPMVARKIVRDAETADRYALAIEKLAGVSQLGTVRLATDSDELAKEFQALGKRPVEVLPIPHTLHPAPASPPAEIPPKIPGKSRVVFLGDAREEKGFAYLPAVVRAVAESQRRGTTEFVFQTFISGPYHQPMAPVIDELDKLKSAGVRTIKSGLSADAYQALLASADLVLVPYDAATYQARTSGPFVEAICAGKPVVVPRASWMSAQLGESKAGVAFNSGNAQDLARAVVTALGDLATHRQAAEELGRRFRAYHNPGNFVQRLMRGEAGSR